MHLAALSDEALMRLLREREATALDQLYERHSRSVYSLTYRVLGDAAASEDVLQEIFLKLWRQPEAYDPNRGTLVAWLLSVTHHRAIDVLRRQRTRAEQPFPEHWAAGQAPADGSVDPAEAVGQLEAASAIRRALAQIPAAQRRAIEMAFFQGKTHVEISAELGEPLGTAKTRIRLGMRKLRSLLEAEGVLRGIHL